MGIYSDLNSFNPTDRAILIDVGAIFQAIFNIINTRPGERLFEPEFGVDLDDELFDLIDDVSAVGIFNSLTEAVERFEDRVEVDFGNTSVIPDEENHLYNVNLIFTIAGMEDDEAKFSFTGILAA